MHDRSKLIDPGSRRSMGPIVLALLVALTLSGCYTMLRHPRGGATGGATTESDCSRCHGGTESYAADYYPWVEYYAYSSSPWINYYGSRWWGDDHWVWCPDCSASAEEPETVLSGRHGWDRRPRHVQTAFADSTRMRDPLVVPAPIAAPSAGTAPIIGAAPATSSNQSGSDPQEEEKEKQKRKRSIRR